MSDLHLVLKNALNGRFLGLVAALAALALFLPDRWTRPFRSVRFNVGLFFTIAIASAIGTLLPQNKPVEQALARFGPFWTSIFEKAGFLDLYHTWWFSGLLGLMAFDVVACKLRGLPRLINGPVPSRRAQK